MTAPEPPPVQPFDWQRMFINDLPWAYLGEVALRTLLMFIILLVALKISGKREVRQLSVFELVLVIGLGSAAGDPMFYEDVPLASAAVVFVVMMGCYKGITYFSDNNKRFREALQGKPTYVIEDGCIELDNFDREDFGLDELFSLLRGAGIEHLGQVRIAILEADGTVSVFPYPEDLVRAGLPILPKGLKSPTNTPSGLGKFACCNCGHVQPPDLAANPLVCQRCQHTNWVQAVG